MQVLPWRRVTMAAGEWRHVVGAMRRWLADSVSDVMRLQRLMWTPAGVSVCLWVTGPARRTMALYGTYLDLSALSTIREENSVEFPVSSHGVTVYNSSL